MSFRECILILILSIILVGCTKTGSNNISNNESTKIGKTIEVDRKQILDYNKIINRTWVDSNSTSRAGYFSIYKMEEGILGGRYSVLPIVTPSRYCKTENFTGTIDNGAALCHFNDSYGNSGTIKMLFLNNEEIEATVKLEEKSLDEEVVPLEGTYKFVPLNIHNVKEYRIIKDKSFAVNLSLWGNVNLTCIEIMGSIHEAPLVILLTDEKGNILFDFLPDAPYAAKPQEIVLEDINEDGLKDVIFLIYVPDREGNMNYFSTLVYLQQDNGCFVTADKIMRNINESEEFENVERIEDVIEFIRENIKE